MAVRRLIGMAFAVLLMVVVVPLSERAQAQEPAGMVLEGDFSITCGAQPVPARCVCNPLPPSREDVAPSACACHSPSWPRVAGARRANGWPERQR